VIDLSHLKYCNVTRLIVPITIDKIATKRKYKKYIKYVSYAKDCYW
jgi:hypothetical protein